MDLSEESPKKHGSKTLLVRHLPAELSEDEKEDLLKYFGAQSVRVFSNFGRMKHTAFATFCSEKAAEKALSRLHQLEILNRKLIVEFAKGQDNVTVLKDPPVSDSNKTDKEAQNKPETKQPKVPLIETGIAPSLGLKYHSNPSLRYLYPPPSNSVLTNITHTLLCVPKFYVQVLHLMNKMNLPCPFGPVTPRPPVFGHLPTAPPMPMPPPLPPDLPPTPAEEMEMSSDEESEYESGDDEDKERIVRLMGLVNQACKRPLRPKTALKRKKPKIKDLLYAPKPDSQSTPVVQPSDVFEQPNPTGPKKIEFHISVSEVAARVEGSRTRCDDDRTKSGLMHVLSVEVVRAAILYITPNSQLALKRCCHYQCEEMSFAGRERRRLCYVTAVRFPFFPSIFIWTSYLSLQLDSPANSREVK
ncbi:RNA-binding region-containing protein 3 isoform X2 [Hippocampus comes]|uniref:RNA-binding region-containing protein 3 isoform X2 n=1 Tax=Hippocampus comes TaxID=109280 RepID=UPI00094EA8F7|nr:PREDICTED: RNA-binding protein 40 isoform X2 [Hippocampus comes]